MAVTKVQVEGGIRDPPSWASGLLRCPRGGLASTLSLFHDLTLPVGAARTAVRPLQLVPRDYVVPPLHLLCPPPSLSLSQHLSPDGTADGRVARRLAAIIQAALPEVPSLGALHVPSGPWVTGAHRHRQRQAQYSQNPPGSVRAERWDRCAGLQDPASLSTWALHLPSPSRLQPGLRGLRPPV